jgi:isopenicillin N synthase-like dioxygenase
MPRPDEYLGPRLSIPFFCKANKEAVIAGPLGKYEPITADAYLQQRIAANYAGAAQRKS